MECVTTITAPNLDAAPTLLETTEERDAPIELFGSWACSYTHRVQLALRLKGLGFNYLEEDPPCKHLYKKPPVLVHAGRPIAESTVILEYVDEVWPQNRIVPEDPFERAMARFWCCFSDDKVGPTVATVFQTQGEEQRAAVAEVHEHLALIEKELREGVFKGRKFFGGETIGLLDIVIGCGSYWLPVFEEVADVKLVDANTFPLFTKWLRDFEGEDVVRETIPAYEKLLEHARGLRHLILGTDLKAIDNINVVVADEA